VWLILSPAAAIAKDWWLGWVLVWRCERTNVLVFKSVYLDTICSKIGLHHFSIRERIVVHRCILYFHSSFFDHHPPDIQHLLQCLDTFIDK